MTDLDQTDRALLELLRDNSRASTSAIARTLGVSRSTVQDRLQRLERRGIIDAYTVRLGQDYSSRQLSAHVMIQVNPKFGARIAEGLSRIPAVRTLQTVSGIYDLVTTVEADTSAAMDTLLDEIGALPGVEKTTTSIVLTTKFRR